MVGGGSPSADVRGGAEIPEGSKGFLKSHSAALVPAAIGIFALWASTRPSTSGIGTLHLIVGIVLVLLAAAIAFMRIPVGNRQDYFGGIALVGLSLFALWASRDLPGMRGFAFGPGTAPRMFAILLGAVGAIVAAIGFFTKGPAVERFYFRGPAFITASILVFAASIRPLGLVIASFASIVVSAAATDEVRWVETLIWAAVLTLFCALLFPWGLNLPLPLWPGNFDPIRSLGLR
jgi:putative tricarboxylic transport membrane protein